LEKQKNLKKFLKKISKKIPEKILFFEKSFLESGKEFLCH